MVGVGNGIALTWYAKLGLAGRARVELNQWEPAVTRMWLNLGILLILAGLPLPHWIRWWNSSPDQFILWMGLIGFPLVAGFTLAAGLAVPAYAWIYRMVIRCLAAKRHE